jgi:hypothetical protein
MNTLVAEFELEYNRLDAVCQDVLAGEADLEDVEMQEAIVKELKAALH